MSNIQFNQQRDWFMYINRIISNNTLTEVNNNLLINGDCNINNNLFINNKIINNNIFETDLSNNIGTIYPIHDLSSNLGYYNKQFNNAYISNLYNNYINTNTITVKENNSKVLLNIKNDNKSYLKLDTTNEELVLDISFKILNNFVDFSNNFGIKIPIGTTNERYWNTQGVIRYNTTDQIYEGHDGTSWNTLGGIRDVDKDTYITAEDSPGSDNDELKFFTSGIERMRIDKSGNLLIGNFSSPFTGTFNSSSNNDNLIFRTDDTSKRVFINNGLNIGENNNLNEPHNSINNFSLIGGSNCTHSNVAKNSIIYGENLQTVAETCANFGKGNNAFTSGCLIAGNYANTDINSNTIFAIGIGDSSSNRINALHIDINGVTRFNNHIYLDGLDSTIYGPSTMYIDPATHNNNLGKLIIHGDLQIDGTTTTINSNIIDISDRTIRLASNATDITQINNTGIEISGNDYYKSFLYKHPSDRWESNIDIVAPRLITTDIMLNDIYSINIQKIFDNNISDYRTLEIKDFDKVNYDNNANLVIGNNITYSSGIENTIIGTSSYTWSQSNFNVIVGPYASIKDNKNNCILIGPSNDSTHSSSILIGFNIQSRGDNITIIDGNEWHPRNNDQTSLGSQNYKFNKIHVSNINTSNINVNEHIIPTFDATSNLGEWNSLNDRKRFNECYLKEIYSTKIDSYYRLRLFPDTNYNDDPFVIYNDQNGSNKLIKMDINGNFHIQESLFVNKDININDNIYIGENKKIVLFNNSNIVAEADGELEIYSRDKIDFKVNNTIALELTENNISFNNNLQINATYHTPLKLITSDHTAHILMNANRSNSDSYIGGMVGQWNNTSIASILFRSGTATINKNNGYITFHTTNSGNSNNNNNIFTNNTERLRIQSNGNIGINTTTPSEKLHINGNLRVNNNITATTFYGDGSNLTNVSASKLETAIKINNISFDGSDDITIPIPDPLPDQSSNAGKLLTTDGSIASWSNDISLNNVDISGGLTVKKNTNTIGNFYLRETYISHIDFSNNYDTNYGLRLRPNGNIRINSSQNNDIEFRHNNDILMSIKDNGFVGIGKITPVEVLDISGNLKVSGTIIANNFSGSSSVTSLNDLTDCKIQTNSLYIGNIPSSTTNNALFNVGLGINALDSITTGDNNIAIGFASLRYVSTGSRNIGIGMEALRGNGANDSVAVGNAAMVLSSGDRNIGIGTGACYNINNNDNVAIGYYSLHSNVNANSSAKNNVAIGAWTMSEYNTNLGLVDTVYSGENNIVIGYRANPSTTAASNEIVIGSNTTGNGSNTVTIGNSSVTDTYLRGNLHTEYLTIHEPGDSVSISINDDILIINFDNLSSYGTTDYHTSDILEISELQIPNHDNFFESGQYIIKIKCDENGEVTLNIPDLLSNGILGYDLYCNSNEEIIIGNNEVGIITITKLTGDIFLSVGSFVKS